MSIKIGENSRKKYGFAKFRNGFGVLTQAAAMWAKGKNAGSKFVKAPGIIFQQLGPYRWGDILALFQIARSSFRAIRVRVVRRIDEEILADLLHDALQERLIPFTAKEYPA